MKPKFNIDQFINEIEITDTNQSERTKAIEREKVVTLYRKLLDKVIEWANKEGLEISSVKRLGGGFVNAVILVETVEGKSVVVKTFEDKEDASNNKKAKTIIDTISTSDEPMLSKVLSWLDETTIVTEKVEGESIRKKMEKLNSDSISQNEANGYLKTLGAMLGNLHERTEQGAKEYDTSLFEHDREKIKSHLSRYIPDPISISVSFDSLCEMIDRNTEPDYISYVHGDAHVDQFFCAPNEDVVTIVDYDSMRQGDPMADLARTVSSIRAWSKKINMSQTKESDLVRSLVKGYRETRVEKIDSEDSEFDYIKVICYEIRLYLIEMPQFNELRNKIKAKLVNPENQLFSSEKALYTQISANPTILESENFSIFTQDELSKMKHMCDVLNRINECIEYLIHIETD
ncbi:MAG: aminoglycoside phosphotransferase family protein [Candidatus Pacebacteria bacterium]|nr:aminoglycoside phosphotransferase family protein [Candidatus Paceibacterota bacterium]MBP9866998.1 aminoglycoside phosphotransferase family protein [Candidatus Paceibacterota bacterium]